jgi:hypothetical protein
MLPERLQPTDFLDVGLPSGATVMLPRCRPIFSEWRGVPIEFTYGGKPVLDYESQACFAELAILRILSQDGWDGVWVEAYGGTLFLRTMPNRWPLKSDSAALPAEREAFLRGIWAAAKTTASFDVFVWKDDQILFCEAKRTGKDKLTAPQLRFIEGAIAFGIRPEALLIVEWSVSAVASPSV